MKTNKQIEIRRSIVLFFMSITFCIMQSCSTEEALMQNEAIIKTVSREQAIQFLQQNPLRTSIKKAIKTNNSPNYDAISQEEISNSDQFLTVIPLLNNDKTQHSRIVLLTINDTLKNAIFTMYPDGEQKTKDFSGRLMITNLSGEFKNGFRVKDGFLVSQFVLKINGAKSTGTNKSASDDLGTILNEVIIPPRKKATIQINYIFDSSSPVYDNSTPDSFTWDFEKYGGGGGTSAEAEAEPVVEAEEDFEDKIDDSELNGKEKCLNELLSKNDSSYVKNLLTNFEGKSEFDIKIISQDVIISKVSGKEINGSTTAPVNKVIVIKISTSQANVNPNLVVARTILHEYIHADIYRKLGTNNTGTTEMLDFKKLFDTYANNLDKDHSAMADLYLDSMKKALKEFHKTQLTSDYNAYKKYYEEEPNDSFYEALAWVGLKESNVDAWTKLDENTKKAINAVSNRIMMLGKVSPCSN